MPNLSTDGQENATFEAKKIKPQFRGLVIRYKFSHHFYPLLGPLQVNLPVHLKPPPDQVELEQNLLPQDGARAQLTREQRPAEPGQHDILPGEVQPGNLEIIELILAAYIDHPTSVIIGYCDNQTL